MTSRLKRLMMYLLLLAGGGMLFVSGSNAGCTRMIGNQSLLGIDWCFIFDCQSGALGGAIDFCREGQELLIDCPDLDNQ